MNNLWHYISGLSLTAKNKQWLSQKLLESTRRKKLRQKQMRLFGNWMAVGLARILTIH